jgi:hypothetical protein
MIYGHVSGHPAFLQEEPYNRDCHVIRLFLQHGYSLVSYLSNMQILRHFFTQRTNFPHTPRLPAKKTLDSFPALYPRKEHSDRICAPLLLPAKNKLMGLRRKLYRTADCATRRGNNFRRRKTNLRAKLIGENWFPRAARRTFLSALYKIKFYINSGALKNF